MNILGTVGGRKFLLALLAQLSCNLLVWFGKISDDAYGVVVLATVAAYITGNVVARKNDGQQAGQAGGTHG